MYYNLYYIKDKKEIKEMDNKEFKCLMPTFAQLEKEMLYIKEHEEKKSLYFIYCANDEDFDVIFCAFVDEECYNELRAKWGDVVPPKREEDDFLPDSITNFEYRLRTLQNAMDKFDCDMSTYYTEDERLEIEQALSDRAKKLARLATAQKMGVI